MSEKGPSPSPDKESVKDPLYLEGVPEALQIEMIEKLREEETLLENKMAGQAMRDNPLELDVQQKAREEARAQFDQLIEKHLEAYKDDEKYLEYVAFLRSYSIDRMPENIWKDGIQDDRGNEVIPPMRGAAYAELQEKYAPTVEDKSKEADPGKEPDPAETATSEPETTKTEESKEAEKKDKPAEVLESTDKGLEMERKHVDELRAELAKLSARRQGRFWKKKSLEKDYAEKEAEYQKALIQLTKDELSAEKAAGKERNEEEERMEAALRIITSHRDLQELSVQELENTKVGKFIKFMTAGGTVARIVKGSALGVIVGAVGAGVTAATAGTAGGAVGAGVAAALVMANRFARGLAVFDKDRGVDVINLEGENATANYLQEAGAKEKSTNEAIELVHKHLMKQFEEATKAEVNKRRKATAIAMGAVVVTSAGVEIAHALADALSEYNVEGMNNWLLGSEKINALDQTPHTPITPAIVEQPKVPEHVYNLNALSIKSGEGWYQTFKDMNIPKGEWSGLLEKVGPQLHDVQVGGRSLAYEMPNGQWGIRMTPDGKMPREALDIISKAHEQMSGITTGSNVPSVATEAPRTSLPIVENSPAPQTSVNPETLTTPVDHGSIQNIIHKEVIQPSDIAANAQLEKLTNVAPWMPPEAMAQRLGISAPEWVQLEDYIASQVTTEQNPLYRGVFEVTPAGYLRFTTNDIPDATMADMLNKIPVGTRNRPIIDGKA